MKFINFMFQLIILGSFLEEFHSHKEFYLFILRDLIKDSYFLSSVVHPKKLISLHFDATYFPVERETQIP